MASEALDRLMLAQLEQVEARIQQAKQQQQAGQQPPLRLEQPVPQHPPPSTVQAYMKHLEGRLAALNSRNEHLGNAPPGLWV